MRKEITNPVGKWWVVSNRCGDLHVTDGEMTEIRIKYTAEKCE